jgi:hypothetical protein
MDWIQDLRAAETEEDFERILPLITPWKDEEVFQNITSPIVLHACLRHTNPSKFRLQQLFYIVAKSYRIDLLEVFFVSFLTLQELAKDTQCYYPFVMMTVVEGRVDVIAFLLENGMDFNMRSSKVINEPILSRACFNEEVNIIELLLVHGADTNLEDVYGETPSFYAMWASDVRILDRLIVHGANLFHRNERGENLWAAVPCAYYHESTEANYQRLADMNIPLDEETYSTVCESLEEYPENGGRLRIMREVMQRDTR